LGAPFAFWKEYFHKISGREKLSRSHNDLNITDHDTRLTKSFSGSPLCVMLPWEFKILFFKLFIFGNIGI
jgi:hypothetical protein